MPDISKCANKECPYNTSCYRFTVEDSPYRQAYGAFKPSVVDGELTCEYYWEVPKDKKSTVVKLFG